MEDAEIDDGDEDEEEYGNEEGAGEGAREEGKTFDPSKDEGNNRASNISQRKSLKDLIAKAINDHRDTLFHIQASALEVKKLLFTNTCCRGLMLNDCLIVFHINSWKSIGRALISY